MSDAQLGIRLSVSGASQVDSALNRVGGQLDTLNTSTRTATASTESLGAALKRIGHYGAAYLSISQGLIPLTQNLVRAADAVTTLQNQLKLATGSTQAAGQAYEALFDIAQRSRVSFTELGGTFAAISRAGETLGLSQQRLLGVTEAIGNAMTISGGSAESMNAALVQLGQGLASGTLRGEELNSVMEQTPRLAKALADGLGVGVGELRKLGEAGEITSAQVIKALESQSAVLSGEVAGATLTVGQAMTQLQNAATKTVGEMDKATGASAALAGALSGLSSALGTVGEFFTQHGGAIKVTLGVLAGAGTVAGVLRVSAALGAGGLAGSIGAVRVAFLGLSAAMAANPLGLALLGIGAAVGGVMALNSGGPSTVAEHMQILERDAARLRQAEARLAAGGGAGQGKYSARLEAHIEELRASVQAQVAAIEALSTTGQAKLNSLSDRRATASAAAQADLTAAQAQGQAYAKLMTQLATPQEKLQAALLEAKTTLGNLYTPEVEARIRAHYTKPTKEAQAATAQASSEVFLYGNTLQALNAQSAAAAQETVRWTAALEEQTARAEESRVKEIDSQTQSVAARLQALQDEEAALALAESQHISLAAAIEQVAIARLSEQQAALMREGDRDAEVLALQQEIDKRRSLATALNSQATREASAKSAADAAADWAKTADSIERTLTDALMRGFESGKGFAQNLRDTLKNMFSTLVLRPILVPVTAGLAGLVGGPAAAGQAMGASSAGSAGGAGSALGTLGGLAGLSSAFGTGMAASFNSMMAAGVSGWATAAGSLMGSGTAAGMAAGAGMIAAPIAAAYAGFQLTKAIGNGYKLGGLSADASALIGGGLGARLFGRKQTASGVQGEFGGAAGFTGENFQFYKGGTFRSDKTTTSALDADQAAALAQQFAANRAAVAGQAATLGQSAAAIEAYTRRVRVNTQGLSEADAAKAWATEFDAANEDMAALALGTTEFSRTGETAVQTLGRLSTSLSTVNQISDTLGWSLRTTSLAGGDAASTFADLFGGLENLQAATSSYYQNFYTEAERNATATRQLTETLAGLGVALPASRDAYRDLIENALASGNDQLAADLIKLSGAYAAITQSTEDLRKSLTGLVQTLLDTTASARAQVAQSMASIAGLPGPTLQQLRDQVAQQQVTLPSTASLDAASTVLAGHYQRLQALQDKERQFAALAATTPAYAQDYFYVNNTLAHLRERQIPLQQIEVTNAQTALNAAQAAYAEALRGYVADAGKAVERLGTLREKTLAYYEAQKQLADGMTSSAKSLRDAVLSVRLGQLSAAQTLAQQRQQFDRQYTLALSTTGMVQAGYADQMASSLPGLSESLKAQSGSRADWARATAVLFAQSQTIASALESNAPKDYQAESLAVLGQIDGTLAAIESAASSAEKIISDAIYTTGDNTLAGLRAVIAAIQGETVPAFATGGMHTGGLRLVGERGPELEVTGPARIYSANQTRAMLAGGRDDDALLAELQALRAEVEGLRAEARATAINTGRSQDLWKRVTRNGEAVQTEVAA